MIQEPETIEVTSGPFVAWKTGNHVVIQGPGDHDDEFCDLLRTMGLLEADTSSYVHKDFGVSHRWEITFV